jgi:hypothetical protein
MSHQVARGKGVRSCIEARGSGLALRHPPNNLGRVACGNARPDPMPFLTPCPLCGNARPDPMPDADPMPDVTPCPTPCPPRCQPAFEGPRRAACRRSNPLAKTGGHRHVDVRLQGGLPALAKIAKPKERCSGTTRPEYGGVRPGLGAVQQRRSLHPPPYGLPGTRRRQPKGEP